MHNIVVWKFDPSNTYGTKTMLKNVVTADNEIIITHYNAGFKIDGKTVYWIKSHGLVDYAIETFYDNKTLEEKLCKIGYIVKYENKPIS